MNEYRVRLRESDEVQTLVAESAQEACEKAGWMIGECQVSEVRRDVVDLETKVAYSKGAYDLPGILGVMFWNAGECCIASECCIAIVAKMGGANDWAAYIGALPWREPRGPGRGRTEEDTVRYTVAHGAKLARQVACRLWPALPERQYRE